jgi:hypothetical protein
MNPLLTLLVGFGSDKSHDGYPEREVDFTKMHVSLLMGFGYDERHGGCPV